MVSGIGILVSLVRNSVGKRWIFVLIIALAASLISYCYYIIEINKLFTDSTHQDYIKLLQEQSNIDNFRFVSAFYDKDAQAYQIRIRPTDKNKTDVPPTGVMLMTDGCRREDYLWKYQSMGIFGTDYILLFTDIDFSKSIWLILGQGSMKISFAEHMINP